MKEEELFRELIGEDAEDEQKQHLEDMMQPDDINSIKYAEQVKKINEYFKWFSPTIFKCIPKCLEELIQDEFIARDGHKLTKIYDCLKKVKSCLKVEVQCKGGEEAKSAKEKKEQIRKTTSPTVMAATATSKVIRMVSI